MLIVAWLQGESTRHGPRLDDGQPWTAADAGAAGRARFAAATNAARVLRCIELPFVEPVNAPTRPPPLTPAGTALGPTFEATVLASAAAPIGRPVALLTITVGLVLPGMIGQSARQLATAADRLATGTISAPQ
jgi:hypothetical protein